MHGGSSLVREAWGRILGDCIGEVTHHVGPRKGCCFSLKSHWRALIRGATGYSFLYLKKKKKIILATVWSIRLQPRAEVSSPKLQMIINFNRFQGNPQLCSWLSVNTTPKLLCTVIWILPSSWAMKAKAQLKVIDRISLILIFHKSYKSYVKTTQQERVRDVRIRNTCHLFLAIIPW